MLTHVITRKWSSGGSTISKSETLEADGENNRDVNIPISASAHAIAYAVLEAELQSLYIVASQDVVITPRNLSDAPMDSITLAANVPLEWTVTSGLIIPFTSTGTPDDVGSLQVANGSDTAVALLQIRSLLDSTASNPVGS